MDRQLIYEGFIKNFIVKEKQQRCLLELTNPKRRDEFIDRLNHQTLRLFKMDKLILIPKKVDLFHFIVDNLRISETELCYIISDDPNIDDMFIKFDKAFNDSYGTGFASVIMTTTFDKIYLIEDQQFGPPNRYIGK